MVSFCLTHTPPSWTNARVPTVGASRSRAWLTPRARGVPTHPLSEFSGLSPERPSFESCAWVGGAVAPTPHCLRVLSFGFRQPLKFFILFLKLNFKEQRLKRTSFKKGPVGLSLQSDRRSNRERPSPAPHRARRWLPAGPGLCAAPPGGPQSFPGALGSHPSISGKKLTRKNHDFQIAADNEECYYWEYVIQVQRKKKG